MLPNEKSMACAKLAELISIKLDEVEILAKYKAGAYDDRVAALVVDILATYLLILKTVKGYAIPAQQTNRILLAYEYYQKWTVNIQLNSGRQNSNLDFITLYHTQLKKWQSKLKSPNAYHTPA